MSHIIWVYVVFHEPARRGRSKGKKKEKKKKVREGQVAEEASTCVLALRLSFSHSHSLSLTLTLTLSLTLSLFLSECLSFQSQGYPSKKTLLVCRWHNGSISVHAAVLIVARRGGTSLRILLLLLDGVPGAQLARWLAGWLADPRNACSGGRPCFENEHLMPRRRLPFPAM